MSNLTSTIRGCYPLNTFETIRDLWQRMAKITLDRSVTNRHDVRLVTDAQLSNSPEYLVADRAINVVESLNVPQFSLIQSARFQALLTGTIVNSDGWQQIAIEITFVPVEIDRFIQPLIEYLPSTLKLIADPDFTNDCELQNQLTQLLLSELVAGTATSERELQLQQQVAQANLLNYIVTQIYQTLDLPIILQAAVDRVQTFLHADRLIVYQFDFNKNERHGDALQVDSSLTALAEIRHRNFDTYTGIGRVAYESLGIAHLQSVLDVTEHQDCFDDRQLWHSYRDGMTKAIDRVDLEYAQNQCMLKLMAQSQIKSKLVVPIVVKSELWGLLIAHQCQSPRHWQPRETQFLQQVAEHLALAIDRAELDASSLWHTQELEHRVNERTRELRDAVIVAQTANQSKTEFLALLSHELKTPLTSILGLSATLLRLPQVNLTDRQQNYLQIIHDSGEHLSELIDDILDFYKLEVGKTFLKVSEFSLPKLIEQVVEIVRAKAEYRKIDLEIQVIKDGENISHISSRDLRFRGDPKRVRQILLNILTNAIKFTPEYGKVIARTWIEDEQAVFEIEDSGIGIEAEQIPRLFKKFHQLNHNFDRNYGGMGLGLAITQQLVELHGGSIEVDSVVGSGSTFTVRLAAQLLQVPRNDWLEMDRKLVFQDPELNPIPNRIILIQQDEDLANFMCDILTSARYQVTWLLSAESSFRQIAMFEPDLLIVDLALDSETVERAIDNIRRSTTISEIKILAIATKDDPIDPIGKQYDDCLSKPVNPEQLLRKITKLLSH
jgi:two-component system, sensor histidine kinase and response regulator